MSPIKTTLVMLVIVALAAAGATAAGYGPFTDLLREPKAASKSESGTTAQRVNAKPVVAIQKASTHICKYCGKPSADCPPPPPSDDISVNMELSAVNNNPAMDARLQKLQFKVGAAWPGYRSERAVEVESVSDIRRQKLELGLCSVEIEPLLGKSELTDKRVKGLYEWTTSGAFRISLKDDKGKLMDEHVVGTLDVQPTTPKAYTPLDVPRGEFGDERRDIFEGKVSDFVKNEPLFSYELLNETSDKYTVVDDSNTRHSYVFPRVSLKVYPLQLMEKRRAERLAQRVVHYGWWQHKKPGETPTRGAGDWGYSEYPMDDGGGCGG